jgi:hypothetical protein
MTKLLVSCKLLWSLLVTEWRPSSRGCAEMPNAEGTPLHGVGMSCWMCSWPGGERKLFYCRWFKPEVQSSRFLSSHGKDDVDSWS